MTGRHRKTKIICTIGPATQSLSMLQQMYDAGMNVVRLNMTHADHRAAARVIRAVRILNQRVPYPVALLLDTQGPEIRTGDLSKDLPLSKGDVVNVAVRGDTDVEQSSFHINYADLIDTVEVGARITVDNGLINLKVLDKQTRTMTCEVLDGGVLGSKRHVNLPGIRVNLPAITEKDVTDIRFGLEQRVDFIALSFVREARDVSQLRQLLGRQATRVKVIAKVEDQEGVRNIDEIVDAADGVMVARGDLGVEIDIADLPNAQRQIVRLCARRGRRVVVATHLLESMISNPIPTRAEVTDVANSVYEGADAIMLSGETSVGKYPVRCVEYLDRIARTAEQEPGLRFSTELEMRADKQHLAAAAVSLAESLEAAGIVVITRRGVTADYVTNCHPRRTPIFAFTNNDPTHRRLALSRGVIAYKVGFSSDPERTLQRAFALLQSREGLVGGQLLVVVSDVLTVPGVDAIQLRPVQ